MRLSPTTSPNKNRFLASALVLALLLLALAGLHFIRLVGANGIPAPPLTEIYIESDGTVNPPNASIRQEGNVYTLTSNLPTSCIIIQRDNIVVDGRGFTLSGWGTHWHEGITLSNRCNVTIKNMYITQFGYDIKMDNAAQNSIIGNRIESAMDGVSMYFGSNNNQISGNWISGVTYGVHGSGSFNNITVNNFTGNTYSVRWSGDYNIISDNFFQDQTSVFLTGSGGSHYNMVSRNTMLSSKDGVYLLAGSTHNMVFGNNITGKQGHGIYITECQNNTIYGNHLANNRVGIQIGFDPSLQERYPSINNIFYHNNLVNNLENVRIERAKDGSLPANFWDDGKEGNYWSSYGGTDHNLDGIGDTPYVINDFNQDCYPLMNLVDISFPPPSLPPPPQNPSDTTTPSQSSSSTPDSTSPPSSASTPDTTTPPIQQSPDTEAPSTSDFPTALVAAATTIGVIATTATALLVKKKRR